MNIEHVVKAREEMLQRLYTFALENGTVPMPADGFPDKIDGNVLTFNIYYLTQGGYITEETSPSGNRSGYRITDRGIQLYEEMHGRYTI